MENTKDFQANMDMNYDNFERSNLKAIIVGLRERIDILEQENEKLKYTIEDIYKKI